MTDDISNSSTWLWLTLPIAVLLAIAAGGGAFVEGLYRDAPYFAAQAVGQDAASLVIALPVLLVSAWLTSRGSRRARVIWLGALVYLIYTYVTAAFDVRFNSMFLVYVALLGCSLYALIGGILTTRIASLKLAFSERTPTRAVSIYLAVVAVLFYILWLREAVPAVLTGEIPESVQMNGTATNAVHVLDMAWILPAMVIIAFSLWRKQPMGYALAGAMLSYVVLLILAILGMVVAMLRGGYPVSIPQVVIFGVLLVVSLGMLVWYLGSLNEPKRMGDPVRPAMMNRGGEGYPEG